MFLPIAFLLIGVVCGRFLLPGFLLDYVDPAITLSLGVVVFCAGIDVGSKRVILQKLREYRAKVLLIPLSVMASSVLAGILMGKFLGMPANEAGAIAAGLGYYSLSSGILTGLGGAHIGSLAFIANILRELLGFVCIPLVARYLSPHAAIAPPGAASMDTALGIISHCTNEEVTMISMINGVTLTVSMPILVPLLYQYL